jgi:hypothetical protein
MGAHCCELAAAVFVFVSVNEFSFDSLVPHLRASEASHLAWFGAAATHSLHRYPAVHRPVDPAWLLGLSSLRAPPASVERELPFLADKLRERSAAASAAPVAATADHEADEPAALSNGQGQQPSANASSTPTKAVPAAASPNSDQRSSKQHKKKGKKGGR